MEIGSFSRRCSKEAGDSDQEGKQCPLQAAYASCYVWDRHRRPPNNSVVVYLGQFTGKSPARQLLRQYGWGRMWSTYIELPEASDAEPLGFDCGAYTAWNKMTPLHWRDFPEEIFLRRLEALPRVPDVAVVPDLPMAGNSSLSFSVSWRHQLPNEFPWHLAVQDGVSMSLVEENIDHFTGLFLGGTGSFKLRAKEWCDLAHRHGKTFHYGRASTYKRVREARLMGADSLDSVSPVLRLADGDGPKRGPRALFRWIEEATSQNPQMELFL